MNRKEGKAGPKESGFVAGKQPTYRITLSPRQVHCLEFNPFILRRNRVIINNMNNPFFDETDYLETVMTTIVWGFIAHRSSQGFGSY